MACYKQILSENPIEYGDKGDPIFAQFTNTKTVDTSYVEKMATQRVVKLTRKNIDISFAKCDRPKTNPDDDLETYVVDTLVKEYLYGQLHVPVLGPLDEMSFNTGTSPGKKWKKRGYPKKKDLLDDPNFEEKVWSFEIPVWDVNGKIEILPLEEIKAHKARTTFNCPCDFLTIVKILYDNQNAAMVDMARESVIKYGYSKEYGGFDRLGKDLEDFEEVDEDDASGYDRSVWLGDVYHLRNSMLIYPNEDIYLFAIEWCTQHTVYPLVGSPDGVIRRRKTGNNSGSNNTCADNSIKHLIICFRLVCKIFENKFGRWPTLNEILDNHLFNIYSDDNLAGNNLKYLDMTYEEYRIWKVAVYAEYGLVLKPSQHFHSSGPGKLNPKHSFLGSSFHYDDDLRKYVPFPRIEKICSSLYYFQKTLPPLQQLMKFVAIQVLSVYVPELCEITRELVLWYEPKVGNLPPEIRADITRLKNNPFLYAYWLIGRESVFTERGTAVFGFINTMNKVSRAEKALEKLGARTGMTKQGLEWLKCAIDPFHDGRLEVEGYPDASQGCSITQCVKQSVSISKPNSIDSGPWDAHLYFTPTSNTRTMHPADLFGNGIMEPMNGTQTIALGGVSVVAGIAGCDLMLLNVGANDTRSIGQIPIPGNYQKHRWRLIGVGIEVHDTTASLYKQGALTVYELPQNPERFTVQEWFAFAEKKKAIEEYNKRKSTEFEIKLTAATLGISHDLTILNMLPHTLSEALLLPESVTWEMKDGAYIVPTYGRGQNPPDFNRPTVYYMSDNYDLYYPNPTLVSGFASDKNPVNEFSSVFPEHTHNFNTKGIVMTGLNDNSTFTVNVNYWIERFPTYNDSDLIVLSKPTAEFDPMALEAYARIMSIMPVGVKVNENGFGDWFLGGVASICDTLTGSTWASSLLKSGDAMVNGSSTRSEKNHDRVTEPSAQINNSPNNIGKPARQEIVVYDNPRPTVIRRTVKKRVRKNGSNNPQQQMRTIKKKYLKPSQKANDTFFGYS